MKSRVHETERLRIEPFSEEHLSERYVAWLADPEVVRWSEQRNAAHTIATCRAYYESFRGTPNMFFAIVAKDPALGHVGNINVYLDPKHGVADVGILLGERTSWGKGFGREAWRCVMDALLGDRGVRKVTGGCVAENVAMVRIMEGCGMAEDGRRRRQYVYDGQEVDILYYAAFTRSPR